MILFGDTSLRRAFNEFHEHYHHEPNHQGLENRLIDPLTGIEPADGCPSRIFRKPTSQAWMTFLDNHVRELAAVDFFTILTVTFRLVFCFIVLRHHRRLIVHFNVTAYPTAEWTAQQVIEAFPEDQALRFLIRDHDSNQGEFFRQRVMRMGIQQTETRR